MPNRAHVPVALVNGRVWTGLGEAEAVALRNGRVAATGTTDEVKAALPSAETIDLEGRRVIPGLIDSHTHFIRAGLTWGEVVRWDDVTTLGEGLERLRRAAGRAAPGRWVRVMGGWHPGRFDERRGPSRAELDQAAPDTPVYVQLLYEEAILNSAGITLALTTDDIEGIERDESGHPTGRVWGASAFRHVTGLFGVPGLEDQVAATEALARDFASLGVTGVIDPGGFGVGPDSYRAVSRLWDEERLPVRVGLYLVPSGPGNELADVRQWVRYIHPGFGDSMLRYLGMGEILSFGCHDMEGVRPHVVTEEARRDLLEITRLLAANDWPVHMHAILDTTIDAVLDVWEEVRAGSGLGRGRFSLAHAEPIGARNLGRVRDLGAGIAVQDRLVYRAADSARMWGDEVAANAPPLRDILELGIPLGAGTDATVVASHDPWLCIWWLVTGKSVDGAPPRAQRHRLSVEEALTAYTRGSAWFGMDEDRRGTLVPGGYADLAVLSLDPFDLAPDRLPEVRSELTLLGGGAAHVGAAFSGFPG